MEALSSQPMEWLVGGDVDTAPRKSLGDSGGGAGRFADSPSGLHLKEKF